MVGDTWFEPHDKVEFDKSELFDSASVELVYAKSKGVSKRWWHDPQPLLLCADVLCACDCQHTYRPSRTESTRRSWRHTRWPR